MSKHYRTDARSPRDQNVIRATGEGQLSRLGRHPPLQKHEREKQFPNAFPAAKGNPIVEGVARTLSRGM
jgi:hypothetical protein